MENTSRNVVGTIVTGAIAATYLVCVFLFSLYEEEPNTRQRTCALSVVLAYIVHVVLLVTACLLHSVYLIYTITGLGILEVVLQVVEHFYGTFITSWWCYTIFSLVATSLWTVAHLKIEPLEPYTQFLRPLSCEKADASCPLVMTTFDPRSSVRRNRVGTIATGIITLAYLVLAGYLGGSTWDRKHTIYFSSIFCVDVINRHALALALLYLLHADLLFLTGFLHHACLIQAIVTLGVLEVLLQVLERSLEGTNVHHYWWGTVMFSIVTTALWGVALVNVEFLKPYKQYLQPLSPEEDS